MQSAKPDVIVHEMTNLKGASDLRSFDRTFAVTNRLRTEGTDHLVAAAREMGVRRLVAQSYCGWPFARVGGAVKSEEDPLDAEPPQEFRRTLDSIRYLEKTVTQAPEIGGIVLRYGASYGPNTGMFDGAFVEQIARRRVPLIGDGNGWWSFTHIEDAAAATVFAIDRGQAGNIYNVVDDEPAPVRECYQRWRPCLRRSRRDMFRLVGTPPSWRAPCRHDDPGASRFECEGQRELGWQPLHPSWRQGFAEIVRQRRGTAR